MILFVTTALAFARPDDGGDTWSFDSSDAVLSFDGEGGRVRVWYSVAGTNETRLDDDDGDGVPDFVTLTATTAEAALDLYEATGFRLPLPDGGEGGSDAFDVYLVDFGGSADGHFSAEDCSTVGTAQQCSGYFVMENDFAFYGYPSLEAAVGTVVPHELFHAVQAAYDASEDVWWSEGTATWAEQLYDATSEDFLWFCGAYLDDPNRTLDSPPTGPVPAWAYGTAIWWYFLSHAYGDGILQELLEASEADDTLLLDMVTAIEARGGTLEDDWITFAQWNLATGELAGATASYPFAADIGPVATEEATTGLVDDKRYYPLGALYFPYDHPGGHLWLATDEDAPDVRFSVHPTDAQARVLDPLGIWPGTEAMIDLGDLDPGRYWLVGINPTLADNSTYVLTCFGTESVVAGCLPQDTGIPDDGMADTGHTLTDDTEAGGGCGCGSRGLPSTMPLAWLAFVLAARRRVIRPSPPRRGAEPDRRRSPARPSPS